MLPTVTGYAKSVFNNFFGRSYMSTHSGDYPILLYVLGLNKPSGDLDEDMFMDVALGRVVARDLGSGSLLVSRIANYEYVRDPESEGKYAMGGWVALCSTCLSHKKPDEVNYHYGVSTNHQQMRYFWMI